MRVGIIAAMPEEAHLLQGDITSLEVNTQGERSYFSGRLYGIETTLVFSRWGKVAAASTATALIVKHGVTHIIFTGVAGAVDPMLKIGDIVIADRFYQHDMDARPLFQQYEIPLTEKIFFQPDPTLFIQTKNAATEYIQQPIPPIQTACVYTGLVASGDQFVSGLNQITALKMAMPELLAVDMESAAVAQVCSEYTIPFVIIRTISDTADHTAAIDFQLFVLNVASHYSKGIVQNLYQKL